MADEQRIVGATLVTQDEQHRIVPDGEVAIARSGRISYVGPARGAPGTGDVDATGTIAMPGMANVHSHAAMTLLRGYSEDRDLAGWLTEIRAFEVHMDHDDIRWGLRLALVEMLRAGITTVADMFLWDDALLADALDTGIRVAAAPAIFGREAVGYPAATPETGQAVLDRTDRLAAGFRGEPRALVGYGPHAPYTAGVDLLREVARHAERSGLPVQIHLAETRDEVSRSRAEHGCSPIVLADRCGLLDVPVLAAHCVHLDEDDIATLADHATAVAHNAVSNLKLGSGMAPVPALRAAGVRVGLGTDSAASNNDLDLFEELKVGLLVQRGVSQRTDIGRAADYLDMATWEGAAAAGFDTVGRLQEGWWGDVVLTTTATAHATPLHDPVAQLAYATRGSDVTDVFVAGRRVVRDGRVTTLDVDAVRGQVAARAARCAAQAEKATRGEIG